MLHAMATICNKAYPMQLIQHKYNHNKPIISNERSVLALKDGLIQLNLLPSKINSVSDLYDENNTIIILIQGIVDGKYLHEKEKQKYNK